MAKYGRQAGKYVEKERREQKQHHKYKNDRQAVAVGLSKARRAGVKVPEKDS
jgi:hypothetical protein